MPSPNTRHHILIRLITDSLEIRRGQCALWARLSNTVLYSGGKTKSLKQHYVQIAIKPYYKQLAHLIMPGFDAFVHQVMMIRLAKDWGMYFLKPRVLCLEF